MCLFLTRAFPPGDLSLIPSGSSHSFYFILTPSRNLVMPNRWGNGLRPGSAFHELIVLPTVAPELARPYYLPGTGPECNVITPAVQQPQDVSQISESSPIQMIDASAHDATGSSTDHSLALSDAQTGVALAEVSHSVSAPPAEATTPVIDPSMPTVFPFKNSVNILERSSWP